jgi:hypothetical protein
MTPVPNTKWRILAHEGWYHIECNSGSGWQGGISGTKDWLGITDEEAERAYPK